MTLNYSAYGGGGLFQDIMDADAEAKRRQRVALAAASRALADDKAVHHERSGSAVGPVEPSEKLGGKANQSVKLLGAPQLIEPIPQVGRGYDEV